MAITVASLVAKVKADTSEAEKGIGSFAGKLGKLGGMLAGATLAAGVAVIGLGIAATKMAGDFQEGMTTLVTGAGESAANLKMVSNGILQMAVDTGTSTKQLTDGMFMIESAGYHGAAGLDVLRTAAEGAKVGNADLGVTANALTTIMKDYGISADNSAVAMNTLTAIVSNGKTTLQDLAGSMSSILPTSSALHVSLNDVAGAMATMTGEGVAAADGATYLRQMLMALASPAHGGAKALKEIGLTTAEVSDGMKKSLPDTLKLIMDRLAATYKVGSPQYVEAMKQIAGGSKQMQGMLDLTGQHLGDFQSNVLGVAGAVKNGGNSVAGWAMVQDDFNFKMSRAKEVVETFMIKLGTGLLPIGGKIADLFTNNIAPALSQFADFISANIGPAIDGLSSTLAPLLSSVGSLGSMFAGTPSKIIPATKAFTDQEDVMRKVKGHWTETTATIHHAAVAMQTIPGKASPIQEIMARIGTVLATNVVPALRSLGSFITGSVVPAAKQLATFFAANILPTLAQFAGFIVTQVVPAAEKLAGFIAKNVIPIFEQVAAIIVKNVVPVLESIFTAVSTKIVPSLERLWNIIAPKLIPVLQFLGSIFKDVIGPVLGFVIGLIGGLISAVVDVISWVFNFLDVLGKIGGFISGTFTDAINGIGSVFKSVFGGLWDIVKAPINMIIGGINTLISGLDTIHFDIPSWVPGVGGKGFGINIPPIPLLADGGTIKQSGYVVVGDAGPELLHLPTGAQVAPLTRPSLNSSPVANTIASSNTATSNGNLTVQFYMDARMIAQKVLPHVAGEVRLHAGLRG